MIHLELLLQRNGVWNVSKEREGKERLKKNPVNGPILRLILDSNFLAIFVS
jgi:hypothetical protein